MSVTREVRDLLGRWAELAPARDRFELTFPPIIFARFVKYALSRHKREIAVDDPSARDPEIVALMMDLCRLLARVFRLETEGVENVPATGPALLVGNHNGGLVPMDTFFSVLAIFDRLGPERAVSMLAHDFLIEDELFRRYVTRFGGMRAGHEGARHALRAGNLCLVYPGGDIETFRTFRDRAKIDLAGRTGFIELALRERVPIVPVVSAGTHEQMIVLTRGDAFARLIRFHAWARAEVFPIMLALPWGITTGFLPYLPIPAQTTVAFGEPIAWPALDPDDPEVLARCFAEVEERMQSMLDRLYVGRLPFLGRTQWACAPILDAPARTSISAASTFVGSCSSR